MGALVGVAAAIGGAIASASAAVASVVTAATAAIGSAMAAIGSAIAGAVSAAVSAIVGTLGAIGSAIGGAVSSIASFVQGPVAMFGRSIWKWGHYIYDTVSAFTEAIHLDLIMKVHDIAYILSENYRNMIKKLQQEVASIGEMIGMSRESMILILKNTETLVKNAGAIMGRSYDLTDVTWLKTISEYLKTRKGKIKEIVEIVEGEKVRVKGTMLGLPEEVVVGVTDFLFDIEEHIIKPTIDTLSAEQRSFFSIFEGMGKTIEETTSNIKGLFDDIDGIRRSLMDIAMNLPDFIQDEVSPWLDDINEKFNYFKEDIYQPFMSETNDLINMLRGSMDTQKQEVDGIIDRLLMPADYLKEIEDFTKEKRVSQEDKISELSSRTRKRETEELTSQTETTFEQLEAIKDILEQEFPVAEWKIEEIGKLVSPIGEQAKAVDTWYVGDY